MNKKLSDGRCVIPPLILKNIAGKKEIKILVVGSKPKFTHEGIGDFDLAFYANAAIARKNYFNADMSFNIVVESIFYKLSTDSAAAAAREQINQVGCENTIVLQSPAWAHKKWSSCTLLSGNVIDVCLAKKRQVVLDVLGMNWMLSAMWDLSPNPIYFTKQLARLALRGQGSISKPSTGIWAVLLACYICKLKKTPLNIVVSGIGLSNDGYSYSTQDSMRLQSHWVDPQAVKKLQRMGVIFLDMDK